MRGKTKGETWGLQRQKHHNIHFSSVQSLNHVRLFATPWTAARLSITNSRSLLKLMAIESVMSSNHLVFCHPLLLPPLISPSIRVFSNELVLPIRWPKYWSFSFSNGSYYEYSGLISFRMDWLDLLAVRGTLRNLAISALYSNFPFSVLKSHKSFLSSL